MTRSNITRNDLARKFYAARAAYAAARAAQVARLIQLIEEGEQ